MDVTIKKNLQKTACKVRMGVIEGTFNAKSGHPGGSLSISDTLTYLYFNKMNVNPADAENPDRDRLVLSKGHTAPALYSVLAQKGYFAEDELKSLRHIGALLQGHPCIHIPGVDMSSGSLGQGISAAAGMALAGKLDGKSYKVYSILGDGEIEEGQVWEAAMAGAHYKLDNLTAFVDYNGLQIDGNITDVMNPEPIADKFAAFGWNVISVDGHDHEQIKNAIETAKTVKGKPTMVVCHCVKGKGVSFMENNYAWHGTAPNQEQRDQAISELDALMAKIDKEIAEEA